MSYKDRDQETICAVSTPSGYGGISVIRISGPSAVAICKQLCAFLPDESESHRVYYGHLKSVQKKDTIDEVLVTYFQAKKSFTGEPTIEISCHGNPLICKMILDELVFLGARIADRGEFTYRAFMNDRIDLTQAESVLGIIEGQSPRAIKTALRQLKGSLSKEFESIEERLIWCLAHIETSIDFSAENFNTLDTEEILQSIDGIKKKLQFLLTQAKNSRVVREGLQVSFVGRPNVGKSSLLNLIANEEKAIVSELAGTTRDIVETRLVHQGQLIQFFDTAGLRESQDQIEKFGIQKTIEKAQDSDLIFLVVDASAGITLEDLQIASSLKASDTIILLNKSDLVEPAQLNQLIKSCRDGIFFKDNVSAEKVQIISSTSQSSQCRNELLDHCLQRLEMFSPGDVDVVLHSRQIGLIQQCERSLVVAEQGFRDGLGSELVVLDLKDSLLRVQEILGKHFDDQILDRVFKEFCIGK